MPPTVPTRSKRRASVIGAGPNGLAAAIVLAQAGLDVNLYEAEALLGGGARTMELTLPGFHHDFGSAVHPMAIGSPFFSSLPLADYGLEWIHPPAPLAHPLDDSPAVLLERDFAAMSATLGADGSAWRRLMEPLAADWASFADAVLQPTLQVPRHPLLLAGFGLNALLPATVVARSQFSNEPARALFAGLAAHSFLSLREPISASFGLVLGIAAHAVGWPIPRGGSQSISNALAAHLTHLGGRIHTSIPIRRLADLPECDLILCDVSPRQLLALTDQPEPSALALRPAFRRSLAGYRYGPAAFKVDYALSGPIPWNDPACLRAGTVHIGGTLDQIAGSESAVALGHTSRRPFVLLSQPTLFDPTRAPAGKHIAWAYCHVPNGSTEDMLDRIELQIERFAPGFRRTILARHIASPATLQAGNANLIGGDINGGAMDLRQLLFRPTSRLYRTSNPKIYLCSASTPPGGGVHGMCGANAARLALRNLS